MRALGLWYGEPGDDGREVVQLRSRCVEVREAEPLVLAAEVRDGLRDGHFP